MEPILLKVWSIWCPLLYFNFESFVDQNSLRIIRFQWILYDSGILFASCWNFYKLKRGEEGLIAGGNQFWRKPELFGPPFCRYFLKVLYPQFHSHSLDLNASCMIQEYFSHSIEISTRRPNFWSERILKRGWISWSHLKYLNFKSFMDTSSSLFIRFQCILHEEGVLFSESWNF